MCGICGFISHEEKIEEKILKKMNDTISYRGPNDEGYYLTELNNIQYGLAHKRLSILDISNLGHQPMFSKNREIAVVFNGEIYNFLEIKKDLLKKGYKFLSTSDTEVIVKGYEEYGIDIVNKLNGMFAIAILDKKNEELYLIRDHLGVKPLYFYIQNKDLVFASELKPIMAYPFFKKEIDLDSLNTYLYYGYISGEKSIFKNIYKLLPGHYLKYKKGKIEINKYWSVKDAFLNKKVKNYSEEKWKEIIKSRLEKSIKERMVSDVPIGAFLSGGIDSSLIVSIMQSLSDKPIKTFTIGFNNLEYNEAEYAKKIADYLGTEHTEYYLDVEEAKNYINDIPLYYDEPFSDSSQLATMLVSKIAKEKVTVSLSGDGGDELFCGYSSYDHYLKLTKYLKIFKIIDKIPLSKYIIKNLNNKYSHIFYFTNFNNIINAGYLAYLNKNSIIKKIKNKKIEKSYLELNSITENIQEKAMLRDIINYLPNDILVKVDRASMAFSLESRAPFVDDYKFLELSFDIPHNLKYKNGEKKYILKQVLYDYIPKELVDRPKQGFGVPVINWLKKDLKYLLDKYLSEKYLREQNIFNEKDVKNILELFFKNINKEYNGVYVNNLVWNLLVFQLWYDRYMLIEKKDKKE